LATLTISRYGSLDTKVSAMSALVLVGFLGLFLSLTQMPA
jgi:hypothetical protein